MRRAGTRCADAATSKWPEKIASLFAWTSPELLPNGTTEGFRIASLMHPRTESVIATGFG
jgi:hypothetical protein